MDAETQRTLARIEDGINQLLNRASGPAASGIADDRDLDSQYGDPIIKAADPRDWLGPVQKGNRFSQCPADYLDLLADRFDYFAKKAEAEDKKTAAGKPVAPYNRKDAARARGWAKRIRDGYKPAALSEAPGWASEPAPPLAAMKAASPWGQPPSDVDEDSIPF